MARTTLPRPHRRRRWRRTRHRRVPCPPSRRTVPFTLARIDMNPIVDLTKLPGPAQKILDGSAPAAIRQMAAKGIAPGLRPVDALTVVALLAESADQAIASTAQATLQALPTPVLNG